MRRGDVFLLLPLLHFLYTLGSENESGKNVCAEGSSLIYDRIYLNFSGIFPGLSAWRVTSNVYGSRAHNNRLYVLALFRRFYCTKIIKNYMYTYI